jgi:hypothetical protein
MENNIKELERIFTEMLNHIDEHKEVYIKWSNEGIVKTWVKTKKTELEKIVKTN